jgi:hypothetical protein
MSLLAGSQAPWLSVVQIESSGPQPMPCGVRRPPAMCSTAPVSLLILICVPRSSEPCGTVVAPPRLIETDRFA